MIDGLEYFSDVVSEQQEIDLLTYINKKGTWSNVMRRRVQHYGSVYQYKNASSTMPVEVPPVPDIFRQLAAQVVAGSEKITDKNWADSPQLQVIVNEYKTGQGISAHIDDPRQFGSTIIGVSLGSSTFMKFSRGGQVINVPLSVRSAYIMSDDSRYKWTHSTTNINPATRISITFRHKI